MRARILKEFKRVKISQILLRIIGYPDQKDIELGKKIVLFLSEIDPQMEFAWYSTEEQVFALSELIEVLKISQLHTQLIPTIELMVKTCKKVKNME